MSASMFSVIPLPASFWNDGSMEYVIPFFPLVGAMIGALWYAAARFLRGGLIAAAFIALVPFLLSGFIHTDGFMDTADAVFSRRGKEEMLRILKDPSVGAFAAVSLAVLLLLSFCAAADIMRADTGPPPSYIFLPVVSRCVGGYALLASKTISETGFAASFKAGTGKGHKAALILFAAAAFVSSAVAGGAAGVAVLAAAVISGALTAAYLNRRFGGMSGDLCGAAVTVSELAGVICAAFFYG